MVREKKMKKVMVTALLALSFLSGAEVKKCFVYNPQAFILKQYIYDNAKENNKRVKLQDIKIYYYHKKGKLKSATVEYKVNGHTFFTPGIYCHRYDKQTNYLCSIECDGGSFEVDENYNIKTDRVAIYRDEPDAENGGIKELSQKSPKKFAKAKKIQCPKNIPAYDALDESYYSDHKNGLYVCYDWKYKGKYEGCIRSEKSCKFIHRQHFGKYLNRAESKKALARCKSSKPNKKFVDNKNGLYVCYDYKDKFGQYSGCFRSKTSCKKLHKEHFGRYPTTHDSYRALLRCSSSAPRK